MSLNKKFRWVLVTGLSIRNEARVPTWVERYSFVEIQQTLERIHAEHRGIYLFQNNQMKIQLRDFDDTDENYLKLLISIGDKDAPDPSYENFVTGETRTDRIGEDEGLVMTCHVLIKKEIDIATRSHITLIEKIPGLSITKIGAYLNYILKNNAEKAYESDDGDKVYRPLIEILGYKSGSLRKALEHNILQDIELVGSADLNDELDEYGIIQEHTRQLTLGIKRGIETNTIDPFFESLMNRYRNGGYEKLLVRIKTDSGQIKQTEIDTENDNLLGQAFINNEIVNNFENDLLSANNLIQNEMIIKLKAIVNRYLE